MSSTDWSRHGCRCPRLLDLYVEGHLKLDELVTKRYSLDQLNEAYADMHAGLNIRGVIDL